jgi:hypothetical protein
MEALEGFDVLESPTVEEWTKVARAEGLRRGLEVLLELKFGAQGLAVTSQVRQIEDVARLDALLDQIKAAASIDDVRKFLPRGEVSS